MFRAVVEEAAALASLALFVGMIAIWAQVLATLLGIRRYQPAVVAVVRRAGLGKVRVTSRPELQRVDI